MSSTAITQSRVIELGQLLSAAKDSAPEPPNWAPLLTGSDATSGMQASAYVNSATKEIAIAFVGQSSSPVVGPLLGHGPSTSDDLIMSGRQPTKLNNAVADFVNKVAGAAKSQGLSTDPSNIFVTGNSLGGYMAQIAAKNNQFGGVSFGGPGIPGSGPSAANNFISFVNAGDPVANFASDIHGISWTGFFSPQGSEGVGAHYGTVELLGPPENQTVLQRNISLLVEPAQTLPGPEPMNAALPAAVAGFATETSLYHFFERYKQALQIPAVQPSAEQLASQFDKQNGGGPQTDPITGLTETQNQYNTRKQAFVDEQLARQQQSQSQSSLNKTGSVDPNAVPNLGGGGSEAKPTNGPPNSNTIPTALGENSRNAIPPSLADQLASQFDKQNGGGPYTDPATGFQAESQDQYNARKQAFINEQIARQGQQQSQDSPNKIGLVDPNAIPHADGVGSEAKSQPTNGPSEGSTTPTAPGENSRNAAMTPEQTTPGAGPEQHTTTSPAALSGAEPNKPVPDQNGAPQSGNPGTTPVPNGGAALPEISGANQSPTGPGDPARLAEPSSGTTPMGELTVGNSSSSPGSLTSAGSPSETAQAAPSPTAPTPGTARGPMPAPEQPADTGSGSTAPAPAVVSWPMGVISPAEPINASNAAPPPAAAPTNVAAAPQPLSVTSAAPITTLATTPNPTVSVTRDLLNPVPAIGPATPGFSTGPGETSAVPPAPASLTTLATIPNPTLPVPPEQFNPAPAMGSTTPGFSTGPAPVTVSPPIPITTLAAPVPNLIVAPELFNPTPTIETAPPLQPPSLTPSVFSPTLSLDNGPGTPSLSLNPYPNSNLTLSPGFSSGVGLSSGSTFGSDFGGMSGIGGGMAGGGVGFAPVILDLANRGVQLTNQQSSTAVFDVNADGVLHRIAWVTPGEGILAFDATGSGKVDNVKDIAFTRWAPGAKTDLQGLAAFDTNHDGKLDGGDKLFSKFGVWTDNNGNGVSEPGEFHSLLELGIRSISLASNGMRSNLPDGSVIYGKGTFTRTDGTTGTLADVSLAYGPDIRAARDQLASAIATAPPAPEASPQPRRCRSSKVRCQRLAPQPSFTLARAEHVRDRGSRSRPRSFIGVPVACLSGRTANKRQANAEVLALAECLHAAKITQQLPGVVSGQDQATGTAAGLASASIA